MNNSDKHVNGIDLDKLNDLVAGVKLDPKNGRAGFGVSTTWASGTNAVARVSSWSLGQQDHPKEFLIESDEPFELLGQNRAANPQELLMSALNACMVVGYVANAALLGITLEKLSIDTHGELDLRGFFGLDENIPPGNGKIHYTVHVQGDGTEEQMREIHDIVTKTSPNRWSIANAVSLESTLVFEQTPTKVASTA